MSSLIKPVPGGFDLVQKLLSESHSKFHILYKVLFANHLPHALYTICCLGASLVRIQEYYDMYVKKLEPLEDPAFEVNLSNAWNYMGNNKAYSEYLEFFDKQIQSRGVKECMSVFFPKLIGLSLGEAFHPLIHIGYGLEFDNPLILSEGFSYACTYPLVGSSILAEVEPRLNKEEWCSIEQLLTKLRGMDVPTIDPEVKNFHDKTEFVITELAEMRDMLESWDHSWSWDEPSLQSKKLNELTESAILLTFCTHPDQIDFFLLHTLTATHAVRNILPHLEKTTWKRNMQLSNLLGLLSAYIIQGRPEVSPAWVYNYSVEITSEEIIAQVAPKEEEHVAKAVRALIVYMETVPEPERSPLFTNEFIKRCAMKAITTVQDINSYLF